MEIQHDNELKQSYLVYLDELTKDYKNGKIDNLEWRKSAFQKARELVVDPRNPNNVPLYDYLLSVGNQYAIDNEINAVLKIFSTRLSL